MSEKMAFSGHSLLPSATATDVIVPEVQRATIGGRWSCMEWNFLPFLNRSEESIYSFKRQLKSTFYRVLMVKDPLL